MKENINISTGEVKKGTIGDLLVSNGIGSCIVIAAMNLKKQIGAVAHFMLPGKAPDSEVYNKTKYAKDAVDKLLNLLQADMNDLTTIRTCLVGAGNVLIKHDDTICENNINSILSIFSDLAIKIDVCALGGINRRSLQFDIATREVYITEGDSELKLLIQW
ncbi:MAG: chemotaxis protein CheD [Desulfobulbaceae bacterium]|nr:chemotaxis protein CheD [Desulfobulbaceae bacterium]